MKCKGCASKRAQVVSPSLTVSVASSRSVVLHPVSSLHLQLENRTVITFQDLCFQEEKCVKTTEKSAQNLNACSKCRFFHLDSLEKCAIHRRRRWLCTLLNARPILLQNILTSLFGTRASKRTKGEHAPERPLFCIISCPPPCTAPSAGTEIFFRSHVVGVAFPPPANTSSSESRTRRSLRWRSSRKSSWVTRSRSTM